MQPLHSGIISIPGPPKTWTWKLSPVLLPQITENHKIAPKWIPRAPQIHPKIDKNRHVLSRRFSGGWCSSVRLHSVKNRPCIFGCTGSKDMLSHYLVCPVLWQLARKSLHLLEPSLFVEHKLCLCEPTVDKFRMLAFCHSLYHSCVNDTECMNSDGLPHTGRLYSSEHVILPDIVFTWLVEASAAFPRSLTVPM